MIFLAALAAIVLLSLLISRNVTKNIGKLLEASRRLATGDFTTRIDIRSRDEIGELGRAFNRMVPDLEERIRLKQGIEVARSVQQSLLPKAPPRIPGLDIAAESRYCDETGGDFFDFIPLERGGGNGIGVAVGDVSGHGISAALLMATARAFLEGRVARPGPLAGMIADVNRLLCRDTDATGQFVTLFYMEFTAGAAAVDWIRAGHDPALLYDPAADTFAVLKGEGAALGIDAEMAYAASRRSGLAAGQIIAVGTDGIWESRNSEGEMFGRERFKEAIRRRRDAAAREIVEGVVADVDAFCGPAVQADDITLVIVKIKDVNVRVS
jgi:sigma-B regulation protein RsbU (phosphoserine phosphatase)